MPNPNHLLVIELSFSCHQSGYDIHPQLCDPIVSWVDASNPSTTWCDDVEKFSNVDLADNNNNDNWEILNSSDKGCEYFGDIENFHPPHPLVKWLWYN